MKGHHPAAPRAVHHPFVRPQRPLRELV